MRAYLHKLWNLVPQPFRWTGARWLLVSAVLLPLTVLILAANVVLWILFFPWRVRGRRPGARAVARMRLILVMVLAVLVLVFWVITMIAPDRIGNCSSVSLRFGQSAHVQDCQPLGWEPFVVPLLVLALLLGGWKSIPTPWGPLERDLAAEEAADALTSRPRQDRAEFREELDRTARGEEPP